MPDPDPQDHHRTAKVMRKHCCCCVCYPKDREALVANAVAAEREKIARELACPEQPTECYPGACWGCDAAAEVRKGDA